MSTYRGILLGTLVILALGAITPAPAAVTYDAILEWTGPYFRVINNPAVDQMVNDPVADTPFINPFAVAAREHAANERDVVYVVDSGHKRIQAFEVNASYYNDNTFDWTTPPAGIDDFDDNQIYIHEWANPATRFIVPGSEQLAVDGVVWTRVADLTGFVAADKVYAIDYDDAANAPEITLPNNSLATTSSISLFYALSDNYSGAADAFGLGDIDYGTGAGATPVLTEIDGASGGPTSFQLIRSISLIANEGTATSDDIFVLDAADNSANQNEELFYYTVALNGTVAYGEAYDDVLNAPYDVAVANGGPTEVEAAVVISGAGDSVDAATVRDASQVTGHVYTVAEAGGLVTITDVTTGRVIVNAAALADVAGTYLGIPGLSVTIDNAAGTGSETLTTTKAVTDRYLFVCDTGDDRIKVISASDDTPTATNDWLPGDAHTMTAQPTGAASVGATADVDYRYTTPGTVPEDYAIYTNAFPIKEGTLETITIDPAGTPATWTRVDDLVTAGPADEVYEIDWMTGKITFGDGVHGEIPPAATALQFTYTTTPDVLRYGSSGTGPGRFSNPRGVAARWNSALAVYDVYVADSGNNRIQKFAFVPSDPALNLPARMDFVCQWKTAGNSLDYLANPVDVVVASDGTDVFVAVADQGNDRVVTYLDNAATSGGGATVPSYDALLGSQGNNLGQYLQVEGLAYLANGTDLDLYTCDAQRGVVGKYEESPTPSIALSFTGVSTLPACFPPSSSYLFSFTTTNPPSGGWIDFYYDTKDTYDGATAKLCIAAGTIAATATSATWSFADTPGGVPADGTSYYLFARMKDANGTVVAVDQTASSELFCMDSTLLPSLLGVDRIDGDEYLYLQNGLERAINLQVAYPESVIAVGFGGTFPATLIEVMGIIPGNGWDGTGYINLLFNQGADNTQGTFTVSTSVTGAPVGLTTAGPHTMAEMTVRAKDTVLNSGTRFANGTLAILTANSSMTDIDGNDPTQWITKNVNLRFGYLGDLATDGSGADEELPNLAAKPDGKINFEDQMIFTLGWNGVGNVQDPISDIGPTEGSVPDLKPIPDGQWNVDDLLAFTVMYSWAAGQGYYRMAPGANPGLIRTAEPRPVALGESVAGAATAHTASLLEAPKAGELMTVDLAVDHVRNLSGALLNLGFDPAALELISVENGGFLDGRSGSLFFNRAGEGWLEVSATRLDQVEPGVSGSGVIARATFRILEENAGQLDLGYDLRGSNGAVLGRGEKASGAFTGAPVGFKLYRAHPNPVHGATTIVYSIPAASELTLDVYDVSGRLVRNLIKGQMDAGYHVSDFDGLDDAGNPVPAGVYFYRLQSGKNTATHKLIVTR